MNNNPIFHYGGHTFQGIRLFTHNEDFKTINQHMFSAVSLDKAWDWSDFYLDAEKVSEKKFDIFLMDGKYEVVPASMNLFIWGELSDKRYHIPQKFINQTKNIAEQQQQLRNVSLQLIKDLMTVFNMSDIVISGVDEKLVHAVFMRDCTRTEAVISIFQKDGKLMFETYNGLLVEDQCIGGLDEVLQRIKNKLFPEN